MVFVHDVGGLDPSFIDTITWYVPPAVAMPRYCKAPRVVVIVDPLLFNFIKKVEHHYGMPDEM
jgi:hypothetical protein